MANKPKLGVAGLFLAAGIGLSGCQNSPPPRPFGQGAGAGGQRVVQDQKSGPNVTQNNRVLNASNQPGTGSPYGLQPTQPAPIGGAGQVNTTGNFRPDSPPGGDFNMRPPVNGGGIHHVTGEQPGGMVMPNPPVDQRRLDAPLNSPAPGQFGGDGLNSSQPLIQPPQPPIQPRTTNYPGPSGLTPPPAGTPLPLPTPDNR